MSSLTSMPADIVQLVGWRVLAGDLLDYVRFRAVCKHLRSSTVSPRGRGITDPRFHRRQWMLLPEVDPRHPRDGTRRERFLNLGTKVFVCPRVPLLKDQCILSRPEGLLLLQRSRRHADEDNIDDVCLLHPFTGDVAKFPPFTYVTICLGSTRWNARNEHFFPWNVTASLSLSVEGVPTLMVMITNMPRVLFAAMGDKQWSFSAWSFSQTGTITSSQGKLYMSPLLPNMPGDERQIFQIDPPRRVKISSGFSSYSFPPPKVITASQYQAVFGGPFKLVKFDQ